MKRPAFLVDMLNRAMHESDLSMAIQHGHRSPQESVMQHVIGMEKHHVRPASLLHATVPGAARPTAFLKSQISHPRTAVVLTHRGRVIR
jgi:hypothetical protein